MLGQKSIRENPNFLIKKKHFLCLDIERHKKTNPEATLPMNVYEYQAKALLKTFQVPVAPGRVVLTPEEAAQGFQSLKSSRCVLKAQIYAGGRGKAGGIQAIQSPEEARSLAEKWLGKSLVTAQTGPAGQKVNSLYLEEARAIAKEFYLSILVDRSKAWITFIASDQGGVNIEEVASKNPEKILRVSLDPATGYAPHHGRSLAFGLGLKGPAIREFIAFLHKIYKAFIHLDASLLEINPLVLTPEGTFLALDAKMAFDDNALFRHPDLASLRDTRSEDPLERQATQYGLSYVRLDGNIGCMVNGAGLAMATVDALHFYGGKAANFLDVGGGADKNQVQKAFSLILSDPHTQGILVNIFGGIMHCDTIAQGILEAAQAVQLKGPLVVRLEGTNVEKGKALLKESALKIITAQNLEEAARRMVEEVRKPQNVNTG